MLKMHRNDQSTRKSVEFTKILIFSRNAQIFAKCTRNIYNNIKMRKFVNIVISGYVLCFFIFMLR